MPEVIALPDHSQRGHSPLGASGAERWMECPGSVALLKNLSLPESEDPSYRTEGTAMHEAAAHCLENGLDTWEITGQVFNTVTMDPVISRHVQTYLDVVRPLMHGAMHTYIEQPISSPVHPSFYGSVDFGATFFDRIIVVDLKGGEGIIVDPEENAQLSYYAFGLIDTLERRTAPFMDRVVVDLGIVQPRGYSADGPVRWWSTTVGELKAWVHGVLVPAMIATEIDNSLEAGPWCRFCPAKLVCPLLTSLFRAACLADPKEVISYTNDQADRNFKYLEAVGMYLKAAKADVAARLMAGTTMSNAKLIPKKADRIYKDGAEDLAKKRFGKEAITPGELKSPAQLEKISPAAAAFVKEFAYKPDTGLTVAPMSDKAAGVKVEKASTTFAAAVELAK